MEQERKQGKRKWLALIGSYKYVLIVVAAGIMCLAWPSRSPTEPEQQAAGAARAAPPPADFRQRSAAGSGRASVCALLPLLFLRAIRTG